jgi:hypothetical protein
MLPDAIFDGASFERLHHAFFCAGSRGRPMGFGRACIVERDIVGHKITFDIDLWLDAWMDFTFQSKAAASAQCFTRQGRS